MSRVTTAASLLSRLNDIDSLLDVGCRDSVLKKSISPRISYFGADLVPGGEHVRYVGDFNEITFDRVFSAVVALDVLEHMEHPSKAFDKMVDLSARYVIVSLPNCYDLKTRTRFAFSGRLGGKYEFSVEEPRDRHRWVMNYSEITQFYEAKAKKLNLRVSVTPVKYGSGLQPTPRSLVGKALSQTLPTTLTAESVIGLFEKAR